MHLTRELLKKRWSTVDLPILPFLAPRVFQPWPSSSPRRQSTAPVAQTTLWKSEPAYHKSPPGSQDGFRGQDPQEGFRQQGRCYNLSGSQDEKDTCVSKGRRAGHETYRNPSDSRHDANERILEERRVEYDRVVSGGRGQGNRRAVKAEKGEHDQYRNCADPDYTNDFDPHTHNSRVEDVVQEDSPLNEGLEDDEFMRKYEEIWGGRKKKQARIRAVASNLHNPNELDRTKYWEDEQMISPSHEITDETPHMRDTFGVDGRFHDENGGYDMAGEDVMSSNSLPRTERKFFRPTFLKNEEDLNVQSFPQIPNEKAVERAWIHSENRKRIEHCGVPGVRTKWVRWDSKTEMGYKAFSFWLRGFAILQSKQEASRHKTSPPALIHQRISPKAQDRLANLISFPLPKLDKIWKKTVRWRRMDTWPKFMMEVLERFPYRALDALAITYRDPLPPAYAVSDTIEYVLSYYLRSPSHSKTETAINLQKSIILILHHGPKGYLHLSQKSIHMLAEKLPDEDLEKFYSDLVELEHPMHYNTLLHFSSRFADCGRTDLAFEVLQDLFTQTDVDLTSPRMMSICTSILYQRNQGPETHSTHFERFQFMLAHGMRPNVITYNTLIYNAIESGDPTTAWQIHDAMSENEVEPDDYTYSILLSDAKSRMDSDGIKAVMRYIKRTGIISHHIVTDILHSIFLLHEQEQSTLRAKFGRPTQQAFDRMLKVYCIHYSPDVFHGLIPNYTSRYPTHGDRALLHSKPPALGLKPPIPTLRVMISGLLYDLSPQQVREQFERMCELLLSGDRVAWEIMSSTHLWNVFLFAFAKSPETIDDCPRLIQTMLTWSSTLSSKKGGDPRKPEQDFPSIASKTASQDPMPEVSAPRHSPKPTTPTFTIRRLDPTTPKTRHFQCPTPDIYTWSILLHTYTKFKQPRAAEKVLEMMQQHGVQPTDVTWNSLIRCYSENQDADMVADTLGRMEERGIRPDETTMRWLTKVRERGRLVGRLGKRGSRQRRDAGGVSAGC